ncbi:MAG: bifunctional (p)ppGpp synthetase/guanosine-3',5'-bis(diphosphate) 3'-pyrophosphohydrolase [Pseudomonadota bacterium]
MPDGARGPDTIDAAGFEPSPSALAAQIRAYNPASDGDLIKTAYEYALAAHAGQVRRSGEPYFSHPLAVAVMLAEQRLDDASIITALLHDTVEDTGSTHDEVTAAFGPEIAQLVEGVTKLTKLQLTSMETRQAEDFRKLFLAMSADIRVLLVKLADRLHNMRTIRHMSADKQVKKARETMDIYAPLAGRMGMQSMREELEDLSFKVLEPKARESILKQYVTLRRETDDVIPEIAEDIRSVLADAGIDAQVTGREKRPYSIWRKLQEKGEVFHRLSDIFGFRIVTRTEEECYVALGAVHRRWNAVPGRFKDYISQPKSNGYRSIHTTVSGRRARRVEMQIRTAEMHEVAESGVAAHWSYRDGARLQNRFAEDPVSWLNALQTRLATADSPDEFLEHVKLEMFSDQVFCFTPKGRVVRLPKFATPIDFAYAIHTELGDSCVGAKVDGKRVPLFTKLRNGQSVVIVTAPGQTPQISWEAHVVTGKAKAAIRRAVREQQREAQVRLGREFIRVSFANRGKKPTDKALETAARRMIDDTALELLRRIGAAEMSAEDVVELLHPSPGGAKRAAQRLAAAADEKDGHGVVGLGPGRFARMAPCCQPVPGERIVGITEPGAGVLVHTISCSALVSIEDDERWVDLGWSDDAQEGRYEVRLAVMLANDTGVLGRICTIIGETGANIANLNLHDRKPDFFTFWFELEVTSLEHLLRLQTAVETDPSVASVKRVQGLDAGVEPAKP